MDFAITLIMSRTLNSDLKTNIATEENINQKDNIS